MSQEPHTSGVRRRDFLKVLGASGVAAVASGCLPENAGKLIPYVMSPDETVPGVSTYYATTCRECAAGCGLIAETRDGRTIKLEGNPDHPLNRGALCARGQAGLQGLYNPDRLRTPLVKTNGQWKPASWNDALALVSDKLSHARGSGVFFNQHETGSFVPFLDNWLAAFGMRPHLSVDLDADDATLEANRAAYGVSWPRLSFADAKVIVSFGADFLEGWGAPVPQQLDFADARAKLDGAPRFIYIAPRRSLTGLNADQWIACRPGGELAILNFLRGYGTAADAAHVSDVPEATLVHLHNELAAKPSLILSGVRTAIAGDVATAVAALNKSLGNVGVTIRPADAIASFDGIARFDQVLAAIEEMRAGHTQIAFFRGVNPVYAIPKSADVAGALKNVPFKVSFSCYPDETTELCDVVLPDLHPLETWGDAEPMRGTLSLLQPAMDPVFSGTRSTGDVLIALAKKEPSVAPKYAVEDYKTWYLAHVGSEAVYAAALAKGLMAAPIGSPAPRAALPVSATAAHRATQPSPGADEYFLVTYPSSALGMGQGANKPWLLEMPDPVVKVAWSSWVEMHPETAAKLGVTRGDSVDVHTPLGTVRAPAVVYLGIRPDTIAIPLGLGHRAAQALPNFDPMHADHSAIQWGYGRYARDLGVQARDLVTLSVNGAGGLSLETAAASLKPTGENEILPSIEGSARQHGRGIAQAVAVADLAQLGQANPAEEEAIPGDASHAYLPGMRSPVAADAQGELGAPTAANHGNQKGLYAPDNVRQMTKRRWAMTIDLARCTGCSACVTACSAENNIPTVGAPWQNATIWAEAKAGVNISRGREMNWLRIERYYEGADDGKFGEEFEARFVPMLCQQCGNAPCEPVCPVYATYHAPDGLNVQVYNRCVGTRYCSNNCPYKVRYFNWFGYGEADRKQYAFPEPLNWQLNPDVTVRGKGVMEKCTFCVQRIREAENRASLEHRDVRPDEFTTSCAGACPSRAIVFGDAADPGWTVTQLAQDRRAYHVFKELNTYPAVVYLKKVNHPTPGAVSAARPAGN